jgi:hypothetical protein
MKKGFYAILAALAVFALVIACDNGSTTTNNPGPGPGPGPGGDEWTAASVEKVTLSNASQVVYRFDLPEGKKWSDYENVSAQYMVDDAEELTHAGGGRTIRLYGNYEMDFFQFNKTTAGTQYAYASLDGTSNNNAYILAQIGGINAGDSQLVNALEAIDEDWKDTEEFAANAWFTLTYPTDGSKSNQTPHPHLPAAEDVGPFIFGLGLPGNSSYKATFYVKNVLLKGKDGTADVLGLPLFIAKDDFDHPAFSAYGQDGANGEDDLSRVAVSPAKYPPAWEAVDPPTYTITFDINTTDATFTAATGLTIASDGKTATKTATKGKTITFPVATKGGSILLGWGATAAATEALPESTLFTAERTLYAVWKVLPAATADLVIEPKIDSFGGLGAINHDAGYGPFNFSTDYQYDAMLWFGLTSAVTTALYDSIKITFKAEKTDSTDVEDPAKLTFHLGRASDTYSGGTPEYVDVAIDDVNGGVEQTKTFTLDAATMMKGILIQHNKSGSSNFKFTITEIELIAPEEDDED